MTKAPFLFTLHRLRSNIHNECHHNSNDDVTNPGLRHQQLDSFPTKARQHDQFQSSWSNYTLGFGTVAKNFWMGLEKIHQLTSTWNYKMRLEVQLLTGQWLSCEYNSFSISTGSSFYKISVSGYSGDILDSFNYPQYPAWSHNGMKFSTYDSDHDNNGGNCAVYMGGGWWFNSCHVLCVNGFYNTHGFAYDNYNSVSATENWISFSTSRMMMKRV